MVCFLAFINFNNIGLEQNFNSLIFYFFWQRIGSIIFFLSIYLFDIKSGFYLIFILIALIFKIGLYPFHFFPFKWASFVSLMPIFLLLRFQKLPMYLLISSLGSDFYILVVFFVSLISLLFLFVRMDFKELLVSSSMYRTF